MNAQCKHLRWAKTVVVKTTSNRRVRAPEEQNKCFRANMEKKVSLSRHFCVSDSAYNSLSHMVCSNFDFRFFLTSHMCFSCLLLFLFLIQATTIVQFIRQHHNLGSRSMWFSSRWLYDTTSWAPITFWKSINYFNHSTRTRSFSFRCRGRSMYSWWLCVCGCARGAFLYDSHRNVVLNFCQIAASLEHDTHIRQTTVAAQHRDRSSRKPKLK